MRLFAFLFAIVLGSGVLLAQAAPHIAVRTADDITPAPLEHAPVTEAAAPPSQPRIPLDGQPAKFSSLVDAFPDYDKTQTEWLKSISYIFSGPGYSQMEDGHLVFKEGSEDRILRQLGDVLDPR